MKPALVSKFCDECLVVRPDAAALATAVADVYRSWSRDSAAPTRCVLEALHHAGKFQGFVIEKWNTEFWIVGAGFSEDGLAYFGDPR